MSTEFNHYGVFVSYRRAYSFFAGRIHDFLSYRGFAPFMDVYRMPQDNFEDVIARRIKECPYFLLVLGKGCFDGLSESDVFFTEIETALKTKSPEDILIVADRDFTFPPKEQLPTEFHDLLRHQCDVITHEHFATDMERFAGNLRLEKLIGVLNWRERISRNGFVTVGSRTYVERTLVPMENSFGKGLMEAVMSGKHYEGVQILKQIRMSCYAASAIFCPNRDMVDDRAYDKGVLFNTFGELLRDPEFSLEIMINAPGSRGAEEAIQNDMLGNRALEDHPEGVFLGAYAGIVRLINEEPAFAEAYKGKRFRFYLTDTVMTGAIQIMEYKGPWSEFDHVKFDLYTYNLESSMDRRTMHFFKRDNPDNFQHMLRAYNYMKRHTYKKDEIQKNHETWLRQWAELQEEL